jgi:hypothetical protein
MRPCRRGDISGNLVAHGERRNCRRRPTNRLHATMADDLRRGTFRGNSKQCAAPRQSDRPNKLHAQNVSALGFGSTSREDERVPHAAGRGTITPQRRSQSSETTIWFFRALSANAIHASARFTRRPLTVEVRVEPGASSRRSARGNRLPWMMGRGWLIGRVRALALLQPHQQVVYAAGQRRWQQIFAAEPFAEPLQRRRA